MDLWLSVSLIGFVISLLLWFYFFHKYRSADQLTKESPEELSPSLETNAEPILGSPAPSSESESEPIPIELAPAPAPETLTPIEPSSVTAGKLSSTPPSLREDWLSTTKSSGPAVQGASPALGASSAQDSSSDGLGEIMAELHEPHAAAPSPAPAPSAASTNIKGGQTTPGSKSPAVIFLQSLKEQLEGLHKELDGVRNQMAGISQKNEARFNEVLKRLEEIRRAPLPPHPTASGPVASTQKAKPTDTQELPSTPARPPPPEPMESKADPLKLALDRPSIEEPPPPPSFKKKGPVWPT